MNAAFRVSSKTHFHWGNDVLRYTFNGKEKENEIAEGDLDFGARVYDSKLGRWFGRDVKERNYPSWSPYHFAYCSPIAVVDPNGEENIIVVGAQYDNSSGNKMMFMMQALSKAKEYKTNEPNEKTTVLLFTEGYTPDQIEAFTTSMSAEGVEVIQVVSAVAVTNYINEKNLIPNQGLALREADPATNVDCFAHGVPGSIEFGYETGDADVARFDEVDAKALKPEAFADNAVFTSCACRTGAGSQAEWQGFNPEFSLAQKIADNGKVTVRAYISRSDYDGTLGSFMDRRTNQLYHITKSRGSDYGSAVALSQARWDLRVKQRQNKDGATWDPQGAVHPVESGSTPTGSPQGLQTFEPKK